MWKTRSLSLKEFFMEISFDFIRDIPPFRYKVRALANILKQMNYNVYLRYYRIYIFVQKN